MWKRRGFLAFLFLFPPPAGVQVITGRVLFPFLFPRRSAVVPGDGLMHVRGIAPALLPFPVVSPPPFFFLFLSPLPLFPLLLTRSRIGTAQLFLQRPSFFFSTWSKLIGRSRPSFFPSFFSRPFSCPPLLLCERGNHGFSSSPPLFFFFPFAYRLSRDSVGEDIVEACGRTKVTPYNFPPPPF